MKTNKWIILITAMATLFATIAITSCDKVGSVLEESGLLGGLKSEDIVAGLKEALNVSSESSTSIASKVDGFLKNDLIKIPVPEPVKQLKDFLSEQGESLAVKFIPGISGALNTFLGDGLNNLLVSINRAAEAASVKALPIFKNAITNMTITDGLNILQGGDTAATHYLRENTYESLITAFQPDVEKVVEAGDVSKYWGEVSSKYNQIAPILKTLPVSFAGPEKVDESLSRYITERGLHGLFILVSGEETKIRKNPLGYASDIIKKVFGSPEARKKQQPNA